jgi:predicted DNA-binding protein
MPERYTPQLSEENVRRLYHLKQSTGKTMVRLLNEIVDAHFTEGDINSDPHSDDQGDDA